METRHIKFEEDLWWYGLAEHRVRQSMNEYYLDNCLEPSSEFRSWHNSRYRKVAEIACFDGID